MSRIVITLPELSEEASTLVCGEVLQLLRAMSRSKRLPDRLTASLTAATVRAD